MLCSPYIAFFFGVTHPSDWMKIPFSYSQAAATSLYCFWSPMSMVTNLVSPGILARIRVYSCNEKLKWWYFKHDWEKDGLAKMRVHSYIILYTLPETNSEFTPENGWLEDDRFLFGMASWQVLCWFQGVCHKYIKIYTPYDPCTVYLPTFTIKEINHPWISVNTRHGSYGYEYINIFVYYIYIYTTPIFVACLRFWSCLTGMSGGLGSVVCFFSPRKTPVFGVRRTSWCDKMQNKNIQTTRFP